VLPWAGIIQRLRRKKASFHAGSWRAATNFGKVINIMSDKDRQKKDGQSKDKKNKRMREDVAARHQKPTSKREWQKHVAKLTDTVPEGEARMRKKR
jgi:hypothetical protein